MKIKMIVSDLDGTLLHEHRSIEEKTKQALLAAQKQGIIVGLASGRGRNRMMEFAHELDLNQNNNGFVIAMNGQEIYDMESDSSIFGAMVNPSDVDGFVRAGVKRGLEVIVVTEQGELRYMSRLTYLAKRIYCMVKGLDFNYGMEGKTVKVCFPTKARIEPQCAVNKLAFIGIKPCTEHFIKAIKKNYSSDYDVVRVIATWTEIMPKGVNKGKALQTIMEKHNIHPDEVMAFGDGENDLEMLRSVRYSIAMGNAFAHVKDACFDVTKKNNEQGIYHALLKYGIVQE
ncbi:MAG: HAD family hydrolase [Erysipelotrichaceae bacterium]